MRSHSLATVALVLAAACANTANLEAPENSQPPGPSGHLVIVGGGGTPDSVMARAIELAGGSSARAIVLPQASSRPEAGEESAKFWQEKGFAKVVSVDLADPAAARAEIDAADFIWFPGGDQSRLLEAIDKADLGDAIRARYAAGAVVGGTSAGAAVMSPRMIVGGETADLTVVRGGSVEMVDGFGLLPGTIVDQHFLKRQRFNRLLSAVLERPDLVGIGIDERTAIVVSYPSFEVIGEGGVLVLDARRATDHGAEKGAPHAGEGIRTSLLRDGMNFDLSTSADGPRSGSKRDG